MKKTKVEPITNPLFALDICQRNVDRWYIGDPYWDDMYEMWYCACLKDIAYLLYWKDNWFWKKED